jgi:carbonyl reductase 1
MASRPIAIVTGANKGIGFEAAKKLLQNGVFTVVACRNEELGRAAAAELSSYGDVEFRKLDIADNRSISTFVAEFERDYGKLDILLNNAAIAFKGADPTPFQQQARPTFTPNYFGTVDLTTQMLPLLRRGSDPRIVFVSSRAGALRILKSTELKSRVTADDVTIEELNNMAKQFIADVENGVHQSKGWPSSNYGMSKLLLTAYSRVLARNEPDIKINACCPGIRNNN